MAGYVDDLRRMLAAAGTDRDGYVRVKRADMVALFDLVETQHDAIERLKARQAERARPRFAERMKEQRP